MSEKKDEYELYETPEWVARRWLTTINFGKECSDCGMDDIPTFQTTAAGALCKWCLEKYNLKIHLLSRQVSVVQKDMEPRKIDPIRLAFHAFMLFGCVIFISGFFLGWENNAMGALIMGCIGGALYGYEDVKGDVSDDA